MDNIIVDEGETIINVGDMYSWNNSRPYNVRDGYVRVLSITLTHVYVRYINGRRRNIPIQYFMDYFKLVPRR